MKQLAWQPYLTHPSLPSQCQHPSTTVPPLHPPLLSLSPLHSPSLSVTQRSALRAGACALHAAYHRHPCCPALRALDPSSSAGALTESSNAGAMGNSTGGPSSSFAALQKAMASDGTDETPHPPTTSSTRSNHTSHSSTTGKGGTSDSHKKSSYTEKRSNERCSSAGSAANSSSSSSSSIGDTSSDNRSSRRPAQPSSFKDWADAAQALLARSHGRQPLEPLPVLRAQMHAGANSHSLRHASQPHAPATHPQTQEFTVPQSQSHEFASQSTLHGFRYPASHPTSMAAEELPTEVSSSMSGEAPAGAEAHVEAGRKQGDLDSPLLLPPLPPPAEPHVLWDPKDTVHTGIRPSVSLDQGLQDPEDTAYTGIRSSVSLDQGLWNSRARGSMHSSSEGGSKSTTVLPESTNFNSSSSSSKSSSRDGTGSHMGSSSPNSNSGMTGNGSSSSAHARAKRTKRTEQQGSGGADKRPINAPKRIHVGSDPMSHHSLAGKLLSALEAHSQATLLADNDPDIIFCLRGMLHASRTLNQPMLLPANGSGGSSFPSKIANGSSTKSRLGNLLGSPASSTTTSFQVAQPHWDAPAPSHAPKQHHSHHAPAPSQNAFVPCRDVSDPSHAFQQQPQQPQHHQQQHWNASAPSHVSQQQHHHLHQHQHWQQRPSAAHFQTQTPPTPASRRKWKPSILIFKPHLRPVPTTDMQRCPPAVAAAAVAATAADGEGDHGDGSVEGSQAPQSLLSVQPQVSQLHQPLSQAVQQEATQQQPDSVNAHAAQQEPRCEDLQAVQQQPSQDVFAVRQQSSQVVCGSPQHRRAYKASQALAQGISVRAMRLTTKKWQLALAAVAAPPRPDETQIKTSTRKSNYLSVPAPQGKDGSPMRFGESTMRRRLAHRLLVELVGAWAGTAMSA